jgi:hypothetical protein
LNHKNSNSINEKNVKKNRTISRQKEDNNLVLNKKLLLKDDKDDKKDKKEKKEKKENHNHIRNKQDKNNNKLNTVNSIIIVNKEKIKK